MRDRRCEFNKDAFVARFVGDFDLGGGDDGELFEGQGMFRVCD